LDAKDAKDAKDGRAKYAFDGWAGNVIAGLVITLVLGTVVNWEVSHLSNEPRVAIEDYTLWAATPPKQSLAVVRVHQNGNEPNDECKVFITPSPTPTPNAPTSIPVPNTALAPTTIAGQPLAYTAAPPTTSSGQVSLWKPPQSPYFDLDPGQAMEVKVYFVDPDPTKTNTRVACNLEGQQWSIPDSVGDSHRVTCVETATEHCGIRGNPTERPEWFSTVPGANGG
jgi:hypothetical protein